MPAGRRAEQPGLAQDLAEPARDRQRDGVEPGVALQDLGVVARAEQRVQRVAGERPGRAPSRSPARRRASREQPQVALVGHVGEREQPRLGSQQARRGASEDAATAAADPRRRAASARIAPSTSATYGMSTYARTPKLRTGIARQDHERGDRARRAARTSARRARRSATRARRARGTRSRPRASGRRPRTASAATPSAVAQRMRRGGERDAEVRLAQMRHVAAPEQAVGRVVVEEAGTDSATRRALRAGSPSPRAAPRRPTSPLDSDSPWPLLCTAVIAPARSQTWSGRSTSSAR